jgi:heme-degrading monooxygenase HmoA
LIKFRYIGRNYITDIISYFNEEGVKMFARVARIQGKPEKTDEVIRYFQEQVLTAAKKIKGFKEGYMMVNRQTGTVMGMTIWESQQGIQDSTANAGRFIPQMAQILGATQPAMTETYEVAVAEVPTAAGMK